jgi:hypothetical protein
MTETTTPPANSTATTLTAGQPSTSGQTAPEVQQKNSNTTDAPAPVDRPAFTAPEGQNYDEHVLGAYAEAVADLKLPTDAAQQLLERITPVMAQRAQEQRQQEAAQWEQEVRADKDIGGDKLPETLAVARKFLDSLGSPDLVQLLDRTGLGNNVHVIKAFFRAGKAISEDKFVGSGNSAGKGQPQGFAELARALYPNQS